MSNKDRLSLLNIIVFISLIYIIAFLNITTPKAKTVSEVENRALAQKPVFTMEKLLSGEYFREYEDYFAYHFYDRENLVQISKSITTLKGVKREEEVFLVDFEGQNVGGNVNLEENYNEVIPEDKAADEEVAKAEIEEKDTIDNNQTTENKTADEDTGTTRGNLLILNDTIMEIYKFNEDRAKNYANVINTVRDKLGENVKVYSLLAPVQIEFLNNDKYKTLSDSQYDAIKYVNSNFAENIIPVDAYSAIEKHKDEYLYFRTDHHWTALGAYYAYTAFAKSASLDVIPLDDYKKEEAADFLGYLSAVYSTETINNNPDNVVYYIPPVESNLQVFYYDNETGEKKSYRGSVINKAYTDTNRKYYIFLGGDFPLGIIKTNVNTDRKIMVIKDSYANAFIPFLTPHYSEIYVVDPRHYRENLINLVNENNIGEVMFLNYILTTNFPGFINSVLNLI